MNQSYNNRIASIDFVRGLVMIIMALDHTRDLFHIYSLNQSPTDLATTTPSLFFTRWITHLCAPTFVFLSGVSAYLSLISKNDIKSSSKFLIKRGLWLIILEITVINFGVWFDLHFSIIMLQVIFAIGCGLTILGLTLYFSPKIHLILGLIIVFCHDAYPNLFSSTDTVLKQILDPLFITTFKPIHESTDLLVIYPPIPWLGIILTGFGIAPYINTSTEKRKRLFLFYAQISILLFLVLRFWNNYGDPAPWSEQKNTFFTVLSCLNLSKYPPSLMYTLLMLGIMFIIHYLVEEKNNRLIQWIKVYGKVPLFYYILHWYVLHSLLFIVIFSQGFTYDQFVFGFNLGRPDDFEGFSLTGVYSIWIVVVILFYPICKWFSRYKSQHPEKEWLRYI